MTLYGNGSIDGDNVTLIYNNKIITTHQRLPDKPITFTLKVEPIDNVNELIIYAENLGSIPPNTALMIIYDGKKRYELNISSTNNSNGLVAFKLKIVLKVIRNRCIYRINPYIYLPMRTINLYR